MQALDSTNHRQELKEALRKQAKSSGFDVAAFAPITPTPHADFLDSWLTQGFHGEMTWMANNRDRRKDPRLLMENLGSILVLGVNYKPNDTLLLSHKHPEMAWFSAYSLNKDYHTLLKKRLKQLAIWLENRLGHPLSGRLFVDTAPVMEKPIACEAGLGWVGKNSLMVSQHFGCWLFLAEFFLPIPFTADTPQPNRCGTCTQCITACPTNALETPYQLKANRCLAYHSIESSKPIPLKYRIAMKNRVYGCDSCLTICPWNRFAPTTKDAHFLPREALKNPHLLDFFKLDENTFKTLFSQSPIKRIGVVRFLRNLSVALGNWGSPQALNPLLHLLTHETPLVRGHAAWGLGRLVQLNLKDIFGSQPNLQLTIQHNQEQDPWVKEEIQSALQIIKKS